MNTFSVYFIISAHLNHNLDLIKKIIDELLSFKIDIYHNYLKKYSTLVYCSIM